MPDMDARDVAVFAVAAYLAVTSLARVMAAYRRKLLADVRQFAEAEAAERAKPAEKAPPSKAA
jgi:hypothetical protein